MVPYREPLLLIVHRREQGCAYSIIFLFRYSQFMTYESDHCMTFEQLAWAVITCGMCRLLSRCRQWCNFFTRVYVVPAACTMLSLILRPVHMDRNGSATSSQWLQPLHIYRPTAPSLQYSGISHTFSHTTLIVRETLVQGFCTLEVKALSLRCHLDIQGAHAPFQSTLFSPPLTVTITDVRTLTNSALQEMQPEDDPTRTNECKGWRTRRICSSTNTVDRRHEGWCYRCQDVGISQAASPCIGTPQNLRLTLLSDSFV